MSNIVAIDFFCGAGGLTRGLQDAGIDVLLGIDIDPTVEKTYTANNDVPFLNVDVRNLRATTLKKILDGVNSTNNSKKPLVLFAGCAPCQPFSKINKSKTSNADMDLLIRFAQIVKALKPDFVISENVPQILSRKRVFEQFVEILRSAGYDIAYGLLNAKHFGVPQNRQRLVLLGSRIGNITLPAALKSEITVRDAISRFPRLYAGQVKSGVPNHSTMGLSPLNFKRICATPSNGGDSRHWPRNLKLLCHKSVKGYYDVYGRMFWDKPAPTLTTRCNSYSNGRFGHPDQHRAISLREAAALQSFPDDFVFYGSLTTIAKHIGNAVPPMLAQQLGIHINKQATASAKS